MPRKKFNYYRDGKHSVDLAATAVFLAGLFRVLKLSVGIQSLPVSAQELIARHQIDANVSHTGTLTNEALLLADEESQFDAIQEAVGDAFVCFHEPTEYQKGWCRFDNQGNNILCCYAATGYRQFCHVSA